MNETRSKRGGARPGAGRKALGEKKKVQVTITITQEQREELEYLRGRAVDTNVILGREIHRQALIHELAELGVAPSDL